MNTTHLSEGRILIVDDKPSIRTSCARFLTAAGFEVTEAANGKEALRQLQKGRVDLVLTDIQMPNMDGIDLVGSMHALSPDLPIILMLDVANQQVAIETAKLGGLQYLVKPIDPRLLERTVAAGVRFRRLQRGTVPAFRNRHGETLVPARITATEAKNNLGRVLDKVIEGGVVFITKHAAPAVAMISMEEFKVISRATETRLDALSGEFDAMLSGMQTAKARAGMKTAFDASAKELGKAAVTMARKGA